MEDSTRRNLISAAIGAALGLIVSILASRYWNNHTELEVDDHPDEYEIEMNEGVDEAMISAPCTLYQTTAPEIDNKRCAYKYISMTEEEADLLARCVEAEAGNQSLYGKQLVVDVIFNRVMSDKFPNTIKEVIQQENQFSSYANGSMSKVTPSDSTYEAISLEYDYMINSEVIFFRTGKYHNYGTPLFQEGAHYFNSL